MYAGRVVEAANVFEVYERPAHPYTYSLLRSIPRADQHGQPLRVIRGLPPNLTRIPGGCAFHPRCPFAQPICAELVPPAHAVDPDRRSACHFAPEVMHVDR